MILYFIEKEDETNCKPKQIIHAIKIILANEEKTRFGWLFIIIKKMDEVSSPIYTKPEEKIRETKKNGIKKTKLSNK